MEQGEFKLLVAGLGKLASYLFDDSSESKTALRLQVQSLQKEIVKLGHGSSTYVDYTVTVVPDGKGGPNGNELGDCISKVLHSEWIPHLNDSESGQAFVYFNREYLTKVSNLLKVASVGVFTFFPIQDPFYLEISNWPNAIKYWNSCTPMAKVC